MKTNKFLSLLALIAFMLACNLPSLSTSTPAANTSEPPATVVAPTNTPITTGNTVTLNNVTITIPQGLAKDALTEMISAVTDPNAPAWEMAPAHLEFTLTSYQLQDKFHQPKIYIYPAQEFAADSGAGESIRRLQAILTNTAPPTADNLPFVPFFNAGQVFAAQIQIIQFQNGSGVRFLTEYAQSFATINNRELFYHFQGLTDDGKYYIIAILPVTAPMLASDEKPDAPVPPDGVPFPGYDDPNADFIGYYDAITEKLNAQTPENFQPSLSVLDDLMRSLIVTP
jgi:hypothetical protein